MVPVTSAFVESPRYERSGLEIASVILLAGLSSIFNKTKSVWCRAGARGVRRRRSIDARAISSVLVITSVVQKYEEFILPLISPRAAHISPVGFAIGTLKSRGEVMVSIKGQCPFAEPT